MVINLKKYFIVVHWKGVKDNSNLDYLRIRIVCSQVQKIVYGIFIAHYLLLRYFLMTPLVIISLLHWLYISLIPKLFIAIFFVLSIKFLAISWDPLIKYEYSILQSLPYSIFSEIILSLLSSWSWYSTLSIFTTSIMELYDNP